jgi:hypothetical protein
VRADGWFALGRLRSGGIALMGWVFSMHADSMQKAVRFLEMFG